jgi:two-component system, NarL family, sensor histidine kinase UhpB
VASQLRVNGWGGASLEKEVEGQVGPALDDLTRRAESEVKRRLARELHDSVAQILTTMVVDMENFKHDHAERESVVKKVDDLQGSTREVLNNLRQLLYELREEPAHDHSFVHKVRNLVSSFELSTGIPSKLSVSARWPSRLSAATAYNLYRIVEEALSNVRLHSGAARVDVKLSSTENTVFLTVQDDGRGLQRAGTGRTPGLGMVGMEERAILVGGKLVVSGDDHDGGTVITATVPVS